MLCEFEYEHEMKTEFSQTVLSYLSLVYLIKTHPLVDHGLSEGPTLFEDLPARLQRLKKINKLSCRDITVHR